MVFALTCAVPACGGAVDSSGNPHPLVDEVPATSSSSGNPNAAPSAHADTAPAVSSPPSSVPDASGWSQRCGQDGVTGIAVTITGLEAYEGRAVYLSVAEPYRDSVSPAWAIPVLLRAEVRDGAVAFACPQGLHANYMYPTWALLLDENDDGRCDANDRGHVRADYYGWAENFEVSATLGGSDLARTTKELAGRALGYDFCAYYFGGK